MYKNRTAYIIAILSIFIITVSLAVFIGKNNRIYLPESRVVTVDSPEQACRLWEQSGLKGRILLLFDNYPHMKGRRNYEGAPQLTQWNFVEYAVLNNIIRKVYLIVPDSSWNELLLQREKRPIRNVTGLDRGLYLSAMSGIQFIATTPSSISSIPEEVLVCINPALFDPEDIVNLLKRKNIRSDITVRYRGNI